MTTHEEDERDAGIEAVMAHNVAFADFASFYVQKHFAGDEVTGDEIHTYLEFIGILPDHPNAWGGFISGMVRQGILEDTGKYRRTKRKGSHARRTPVWYVNSSTTKEKRL